MHKAQASVHKAKCRMRIWALFLVLCALLVVAVLLFPRVASAYQVERAGRWLDRQTGSGDPARAAEGGTWAERVLRSALHWNPRNAQAYRLLAQLYRLPAAAGSSQGKQLLSAADAWAHFVTLRPSDPQGYWELAAACEALTLSELAQVPGEPCGSDAPSRQRLLVQLWRSAGQSADDFVRAGNSFRDQKGGTQDPASLQAQAMAFYQRALLLDPTSARAWSSLADLYRTCSLAPCGRDSALDAYAHVAALTQDPEVAAAAHASRGQILADAARWAEASKEMAQAVALEPGRGEYHLSYGSYLSQALSSPAGIGAGGEEFQLARQELARAASLMPASPWPHVYLASLEYAAKDYAAALDEARLVMQIQPDLFWGWLWQGKALGALGRMADAEASLRRAVELAPDKPAPHADLGQFLRQAGRLAEAIAEYDEAVHLAPDNLPYWLSLADAYRASGQLAEAAGAYRRVLELDAANAVAKKALQELP